MQRRKFIKDTVSTSAGILLLPALSQAASFLDTDNLPVKEALEHGFLNPPKSARPHTFWTWMNGNITKEGITLDLEAMHQMGIGGAFIFNNAVGIPRGPVDYASESWMDMVYHAVQEAERLDIKIALQNSPGYSGTGGPWITPEMSMQELVWTETLVSSTGKIAIELAKPYAKLGYYKDAFVIAYPSLPVEKSLMKDQVLRVLANGKEIDKRSILDNNPETKIRIEPVKATGKAVLLFEFKEPFEARAISIHRFHEEPIDPFDGPRDYPPVFSLETSDDGNNFQHIATIRMPAIRNMDTPGVQSFKGVKAKYFRLISQSPTWISTVELHSGPRLPGWSNKINYSGNLEDFQEEVPDELIINPEKVKDISDKMDANGRLSWNAPAGNWTILRIGHTTTGETVGAAPDSGIGLECDKFRKEALDFHFASFLDKVFKKLGRLTGTSLVALMSDSWEAGKQNWSVSFPQEFKKYRGYDIVSWLPAMTGRIMRSTDVTERFLSDIRLTHADLANDNYYGYLSELCHKRGLQLWAEPYGDGPFDSLQVSQQLDVPMGEFWTRYIYGDAMYSRQAASAAHAYGKKIAASEAFTGMPATANWTEYPYSLKAEGDWFFTLGINRLVFHTFVHQPYTTGLPGMTMGPFGTHFDRNSTWTNQAYGWTTYLTRAQYLLQQGIFVADVAYFKGEEPASGIPNINRIAPSIPEGFCGDVVSKEALFKRFKINQGKIILPDGLTYSVLIMAPVKNISLAVLQQIKELVAQGMILVVNSKPQYATGLNNQPESNDSIKELINDLWENLNGTTVTEHPYGKGKLYWGKPLTAIFGQLNIKPDFLYTAQHQDAAIHFIHKKTGYGDIYFISNHLRRKEKVVCSFKITGMQPEIWNAETGEIYDAVIFEQTAGRTYLPLELEPAGSVFVVFKKQPVKEAWISAGKNSTEIISAKPFEAAQKDIYAAVQNNFSVTAWVKPDTFAHRGKSILIYPPLAEQVYGNGHAAFGLSAGQNGVRIYEHDKGPLREVLFYEHPIEGWTHLAVVYQDGKPKLYVNGELVAQNAGSGKIIHPGLDTPASEEQFQSYFEGNSVKPQLFKEVLSYVAVKKLFSNGLPEPELPSEITVKQNPEGKTEALIFQNGKYTLKRSKGETKVIEVLNDCRARLIDGSWKVIFPVGLGAPAGIVLPKLMSLHKHPDFNIKHFSGTATYIKSFEIHPNEISNGKQLYLDLGRVEVVAEIKVNGHNFDVLWKEPFRLNITKALRSGANAMEIKVTNLWPNRLIGDGFSPAENKYDEHGPILKLPEWYVKNQPKPGKRIAFSVWQHYEQTDPLFESGLLGLVRLITAVKRIV